VQQLDLAIADHQRLLRKQPQDDEAANRLAELYARAGRQDEAVSFFSTLAEALFTRNRLALAAGFYGRILQISPGHAPALIRSGEIAAADRRFSDAHGFFGAAADQRMAEGDAAGAAAIRSRIDNLDLTEVQERLTIARLRTNSGVEFNLLDSSLRTAVQSTQAPDIRFRARLAKSFLERGDAAAAAECLTPEMAGGDPQLLLTIAEVQLRGGKIEEAVALVEHTLARHPAMTAAAARLGTDVAAHMPSAGFRFVELAIARWSSESNWTEAAAALETFMAVAPDYSAAKTRMTHVRAMAAMAARLSAIASKARSTILSFQRPAAPQSPAEPR
jgi:tetratricopeptide (TPR) repeat protein